jgi:hypothetical protein
MKTNTVSKNLKAGPSRVNDPASLRLILLFACFFAISLARQSFLYAALFPGLQVKRVPLHFFNDVLLLNLTFEAAQGVFQWFAFLQPDFSQRNYTSQLTRLDNAEFCSVL